MNRRTKLALERDKKIKALHGGKRISAEGNVYYENRPNRTDLNRTKKFGKGGDLWTPLDFTSIEEYFDYINDSLINGNRTQVKELYNDMDESQKRQFFRYANMQEGMFDEVVDYINENVRKYAKGGGVTNVTKNILKQYVFEYHYPKYKRQPETTQKYKVDISKVIPIGGMGEDGFKLITLDGNDTGVVITLVKALQAIRKGEIEFEQSKDYFVKVKAIKNNEYAKGGGVSVLKDKIDHINKNYDGVVASKTYSDNRIQVVSPYFNTLNDIKRNEFDGSGLLERYGNTTQYVLYSNKTYAKGGGLNDSHLDDLYNKSNKNVQGALELYAGELGIYNMFYGHKVDASKKAKYKKAQKYLESKYMAKGGELSRQELLEHYDNYVDNISDDEEPISFELWKQEYADDLGTIINDEYKKGVSVDNLTLEEAKEKFKNSYCISVPYKFWNYETPERRIKKYLKSESESVGEDLISATWSTNGEMTIISSDESYVVPNVSEKEYDEFWGERDFDKKEEYKKGGKVGVSKGSNGTKGKFIWIERQSGFSNNVYSQESFEEVYNELKNNKDYTLESDDNDGKVFVRNSDGHRVIFSLKEIYSKGGSVKQKGAQYNIDGYGSGDRKHKAKPVGFRYERIRDPKTGKLRVVTKEDKKYYATPTQKEIKAYQDGDVTARKMLGFENRADHSDKEPVRFSRKFAKGGSVTIGEHKATFKVKYSLDGEKQKDGYIVSVLTPSQHAIDYYLLYDKSKKLVKEISHQEGQELVKDKKIILVKRYDVPNEKQKSNPDTEVKDMSYAERREWIKENIVPNLKSAVNYWNSYNHGSFDSNDEKSEKEFLDKVRKSAMYGSTEAFQKATSLKVDDSGWGLESPEGEEFEQVASDNTYNSSYLGLFDWNFRIYSIYDERFVLIAHPHMGGDVRGNYGDPIFLEGESKEDVLMKFYEEVIDGKHSVNLEFKDGTSVTFDAQQDSDVNYYELYDDGSKNKKIKLGSPVEVLTTTFKTFGGWKGDDFVEEIVDEFERSKDKNKKKMSNGGGVDSSDNSNYAIIAYNKAKLGTTQNKGFQDAVNTAKTFNAGSELGNNLIIVKGNLLWTNARVKGVELENGEKIYYGEYQHEYFTENQLDYLRGIMVEENGDNYNQFDFSKLNQMKNGGGVEDTIAERYARLTEAEAKRLDELAKKVEINEQTESEDAEFDRLVHKYRAWDKMANGGGVGDIKVGGFVKKKGSNLELKVLAISNNKNDGKDYITIYNDVTGSTQTVNNISDYELVKYANGGGIGDKFQVGDLVFNSSLGSRGLVGLVISEGKENEEYETFEYDVLYRGYSGDVIPTEESEIVDITEGYIDFAEGNGDLMHYPNIAKKNGITLNTKYQEAIDENSDEEEFARGGHVSKGELVWGKLSSSDKINFLHENFTPEITPRTQQTLVGKTFNFLPKNVKIKIEAKYANVEEYANGGGVNEPELLIDANRGIYVPQTFYERYDFKEFGLNKEDYTELSDPENEGYWDAWNDVVDTAETKDGKTLFEIEGNLFLADKYHDFDLLKKGGSLKKTKAKYVELLNEIGVPEHEHPEYGGRVPYKHLNTYGLWLRKNDPIAFNVGYSDWASEDDYKKGGSVGSFSLKKNRKDEWINDSGQYLIVDMGEEYQAFDLLQEHNPEDDVIASDEDFDALVEKVFEYNGENYKRGGVIKQRGAQYHDRDVEKYGNRDTSVRARPVGYRYRKIVDKKTGRLRNIEKTDKEYYKPVTQKDIQAYEEMDKSARKRIYKEVRKDHSDKPSKNKRAY